MNIPTALVPILVITAIVVGFFALFVALIKMLDKAEGIKTAEEKERLKVVLNTPPEVGVVYAYNKDADNPFLSDSEKVIIKCVYDGWVNYYFNKYGDSNRHLSTSVLEFNSLYKKCKYQKSLSCEEVS